MNATFVLLTATWLAGDAPVAQQPAAPAHAPVVVAAPSHGCGSCCNTCCDCCDESWGKKMMGRMRGLFSKKNDCCEPCCTPCCPPPPCCTPCCPPPCDDCCSNVEGWWGRVKGAFGRKKCDDCCGCGGHGSTVVPAPAPAKPAGEPIPAPGGAKEMPKGDKGAQFLIPRPLAPVSNLSLGQ